MSDTNTYLKCSGCGEQIAVPAEIYGGEELTEPYYCDACEREGENAVDASLLDYSDGDYCSHCGKDIYDWSDLGCEYCDRRHPYFGVHD